MLNQYLILYYRYHLSEVFLSVFSWVGLIIVLYYSPHIRAHIKDQPNTIYFSFPNNKPNTSLLLLKICFPLANIFNTVLKQLFLKTIFTQNPLHTYILKQIKVCSQQFIEISRGESS